MMRYVIDIDGTICFPGAGEGRYSNAVPRWDRIQEINKLYDEGNHVVYLTARGMGSFDNSRELAEKEFYNFTESQLKSWGVSTMNFILVNLLVTTTSTTKE